MLNSDKEEIHMSKEFNNKIITYVQNAIYEMTQILHIINKDNAEFDEGKKR